MNLVQLVSKADLDLLVSQDQLESKASLEILELQDLVDPEDPKAPGELLAPPAPQVLLELQAG